AINLAQGDTLDMFITGHDVVIEGVTTPNVVTAEILSSFSIRLIGENIGETQLIVKYLLNVVGGPKATGIAYWIISVTDGIPLQLTLGEAKTVQLADYLSAEQFDRIDSISVLLPDSLAEGDMDVQIAGSTVSLQSNLPGVKRVEILALDRLGVQIIPLLFETQTSIWKRVLGELFTNAGCVNCPVANENFDHLYEEYPENFTAIRYHVFWTDPNDPMNLYNPTEVEDRRLFYGGSYEAPRLLMEGVPTADYENLDALKIFVNLALDSGSDVHIWKPAFNSTGDSLFVDYRIQNFGAALDNLICWTVLTENSIYYAGTNGETIHMQVMRDMTATEIAELDGVLTVQQGLKLAPEYAASAAFHLVIFLQDLHTKEILQTIDHTILELSASGSENP
ncbi:MAG: hypothetical protein L3J79_07775, partial [Candidatus Marinimicrobia bacterium]|nr:hypothetical protein [Candidatus Neomarinimicrobiota bacterium]